MVTESKYTAPLPRTVATTLALDAATIPSATGRSIPGMRARTPRQAAR